MLRLMLDSHSNIAIPFETDFILPLYCRRSDFGDLRETNNVRGLLQEIRSNRFVQLGEMAQLSEDLVLAALTEHTYPGVVDAFFRTWAHTRGKSRWGDKNPAAPQIHMLNDMFPAAMFLHIIRDGRDVAASLMRVSGWGEKSVLASAHHWCWNVAFVRQVGRTLGSRYKEIRYETLVREPERTLREICDWLGEPYESSMLDYHTSASERMPAHLVKVEHRSSVGPPDPSKIGMARHLMGRGDRAVFQTVAHDLLDNLGYELEDEKSLGFRLARKISEVRHAVRGLAVFPFPGRDYWT
jgi:hypothetical protein